MCAGSVQVHCRGLVVPRAAMLRMIALLFGRRAAPPAYRGTEQIRYTGLAVHLAWWHGDWSSWTRYVVSRLHAHQEYA